LEKPPDSISELYIFKNFLGEHAPRPPPDGHVSQHWHQTCHKNTLSIYAYSLPPPKKLPPPPLL